MEEQASNPNIAIAVKGFKSIAEEQRVDVRPLTLLAGANSSGKSSTLQPLLLLKQTLEVPFDPGPILLDGPHVQFTSSDQLLSKVNPRKKEDIFSVGVEVGDGAITNTFSRAGDFGLELMSTSVKKAGEWHVVKPGMSTDEMWDVLGQRTKRVNFFPSLSPRVKRNRCFYDIEVGASGSLLFNFSDVFVEFIRSVIHVPALRGNPSRSYRTAAVDRYFPGTFENYVASVILAWQTSLDPRLDELNDHMRDLGLATQVLAKPIDATQVELLVGRTLRRGDLVNIVDVGFGVSQTLPVLVALLAAGPNQILYIEQPELHLHPRAQQALASILADAANRGVRVVAETHSTILLRAVQTLVAQDKLDTDKVILHWFQRDKRGATKITSAELDERGAYGEWPEDFGEVEAAVDNAYLDAVEAKMFPPEKKRNARK